MTVSLPGDHRHPALLPQTAKTRNREWKVRLISSQVVSFAFVYIRLCSMFKYLFYTNIGLHWNQLMANAPDAPVPYTSSSSSPFSLISWQASNIVRPVLSFTHQYNNHHMPFVESGGYIRHQTCVTVTITLTVRVRSPAMYNPPVTHVGSAGVCPDGEEGDLRHAHKPNLSVGHGDPRD